MIDDRIVSYIEYYIIQGYSELEIANHLIKQGYKFSEVWGTIKAISKKLHPAPAHNIH